MPPSASVSSSECAVGSAASADGAADSALPSSLLPGLPNTSSKSRSRSPESEPIARRAWLAVHDSPSSFAATVASVWECTATGCVFSAVMWAVGGRPPGPAALAAAAGWPLALACVLMAGRPGCRTLEGGTAAKGLASVTDVAVASEALLPLTGRPQAGRVVPLLGPPLLLPPVALPFWPLPEATSTYVPRAAGTLPVSAWPSALLGPAAAAGAAAVAPGPPPVAAPPFCTVRPCAQLAR
jgi:hypothetical protein